MKDVVTFDKDKLTVTVQPGITWEKLDNWLMSRNLTLRLYPTRSFTGEDVDLVSDAEGITGFISEVTLRIQPKEEVDVVSVACPDAHDTQGLVNSIIEAGLPIWSMVFINPRMAELKNKAPLMEEHGHPAEERVLLPEAYILTLAFRKGDSGRTARVESEDSGYHYCLHYM